MLPITAVIPNWNRADLLGKLLSSLAAIDRILVIDGASTDSSAAVAAAHGAEFHSLNANPGFAAAVNTGVGKSSGAWLAILNNDVELAPDYLAKLLAAAESTGAAFATGKILSFDDHTVIDGSFDLVSRGCCAWRAGSGAADCPIWNLTRPVQLPPFTALLIRREVFAQIGPLDESFESYLEDADFGIRCARAGFAGVYEPAASAIHRGSATLGAWSPRSVYLISRNQVLLAAKHACSFWPVLAGQVLWGLLALRHRTGFAWLRGKIDGLRRYRAVTRNPAPADFFTAQESQIRSLSNDTYWRWYFRLT